MADDTTIARNTLLAIRRQLDERRIPLKVCAADAGVSYSTFLSWFPADGLPQVPSLAALAGLARALPADLFDLLLPDGLHCAPCPEGIDYDDFAAGCMAFLAEKEKAHHPESPAGRDIADCERDQLDMKIIPIRGKVA